MGWLAASHLAAVAAPTSEEPIRASSERPPPIATRGSTESTAANTDGGHAVNMLIQMQPQTPGIEFKQDRPGALRRQPSGAGVGPATVLPPPPQPGGSTLFGVEEAPRKKAETRGNSEWTPVATERAPTGDPIEPGRAKAAAMAEPGWLASLPREVVQYLRENREWIVGGVLGAMALFWVGSATLARRRR